MRAGPGSYVFLTRPHLFRRYLLLSPSLWFNSELLLEDASDRTLEAGPTALYLGAGTLEPRIGDETAAFADILLEKDVPNLRLKAEILENETHRTVFGRGFTNGLRFIYAGG